MVFDDSECVTMFLQSEDVLEENTPVEHIAETTTSQVLTFIDKVPHVTDVANIANPIATADQTHMTSLQKFLSRPTLINTRVWTTSTPSGLLGSVISPWHLFLDNDVIQRKIENYAMIRATLCIKPVINGTPFHFGLLRMAYEPHVGVSGSFRVSKIRTNTVSSNPLITPYSQLPGSWIYPADNSAEVFKVPIFYPANWVHLNDADTIKGLGKIDYYVAFPLSTASATASTSITLDTFAWLEDVQLNGSTEQLTLQAADEYEPNGVISAPATFISNAAKQLTSLPVIGKFARATEIGAGAIANIARLFGFTNVQNISDPSPMVPFIAPHLATSEISVPYQKLTLDPKQELSIDPTLHNIPATDELSIQHLVGKSSTLVMGGWSTSDTVGDVLFNSRINPMNLNVVDIVDGSSVTKAYRVYHTTLSYLACLFQNWRGDIIYDIEVICTKFHKGRLKISWDPLGETGAVAMSENKVYTTILDIGSCNKVSIRVPYHAQFSFLRVSGPGNEPNWTPGNALAYRSTYDNGLLNISVLTPLVSPISPSNVGLKISVRGADNFEFANPRTALGSSYTSPPPSFFAVQSADVIETTTKEITFGDEGACHPQRHALNMGEAIVSLRQLLHRMSNYDVSFTGSNTFTKAGIWAKTFTRFPPSYGYDPVGKSTAVSLLGGSNKSFNFTPMHPIAYIGNMFAGYRGSVNFINNIECDTTPSLAKAIVVRNTFSSDNTYKRGNWLSTLNTGATGSAQAAFFNDSQRTNCLAGGAITNTITNGALQWTFPDINASNFFIASPELSISGSSEDLSSSESCCLSLLVKQTTANTVTDTITVSTFAGTGPDFTLLWFLCCPTIDYYVSTPAGA